MGTTLTGKIVAETYDSLLKVTDNNVITGTKKRITDGLGNDTPLLLSSTDVQIDGNFLLPGTTLQYVRGDGSVATFPTFLSADKLITEVYNNSGATLTKGTIVYINGTQGNLPTIAKALATGDSTSAQTFGFVQTDITNMNNGYVIVAGKLSDLDTSAYTGGTQLYLSPTTAGTYTSTKQYAPNHLVYVGIVVRAHPTQGIIEVKIQNGYELDELHDVIAQTPSNNDGIFYNSTSTKWENKSIATALGYTPLSGSGTTNTLPKFTATSALGNSNITDSGTLITLGSGTRINGGVGFNVAPSANIGFRISTAMTGGTSAIGLLYDGVIQSDATATNGYIRVASNTAVASFTSTNINLFQAGQGTFGAGSVVTNQNGFIVTSTLIGATNNFGFRGQIDAGTGRWNLYMDGTANNYLAGSLGIGSTALTDSALRISKTITGSTTASGIQISAAIQSDVTSSAIMFQSTPSQAAGGTLTTLYHFSASQSTLSGTITNQIGYQVFASVSGATNNRAFQGQIVAATNNYNLYMSGTAQNYLAGNLGIGTTSPSAKLHIVGGSTTTSIANAATTLTSRFDLANSAISFGIGYVAADIPMLQGFNNGTNTATNITINPFGGNVGIGTTTPTSKLSVWQGEITISNLDASYTVPMGSVGAYNADATNGGLIFKTSLSGTLAEKVRIQNNGYVGIGTTSPAILLDINSSTTNDRLALSHTGSAKCVFGVTSAGANYLYHHTSSTFPMYISTTGNFGIGTASPSRLLSVNGQAFVSADIFQGSNSGIFFSGDGSYASGIYGRNSGLDLALQSNSAERMRINSSGNVLIGTTSDNSTTAKLQVTGGISYQNIFNAQSGTTYTLVLTDQNKIIEMSNASPITLTIPTNASVAFPIGTEIQVLQFGAGQVTIAAASGVTTKSKSGQLKIANQNTGVTLVKRATDDWYVIGNLTA